jgi:Flp pilus assembly protein TadD
MRRFAAPFALLTLAIVPHAASLDGDWIIDDEHYVAENRLLDDVEGLGAIWTRPSSLPQYYPLVFTTFWLERQLFGLDPRAFHATNLLLHAAVTLLIWNVLGRVGSKTAWLAAAFFAVHPIHVDTVAWISERKNLLSALFALLAARAYLVFERRRSEGGRVWTVYLASLGGFVLAMLAKTAVLGLPIVLALLVWWRRERLQWKDLRPLTPFVVAGGALALVTIGLEGKLVAGGDSLPEPGAIERPLLAARATLFYLGKLAWPAQLAFDYGTWPTGVGEPRNLLSGGLLAGLAAGLWAGRRIWGRAPLVALLAFLALAAPALGFASFYFHRYSFVADHFVYLASVPVLALYAAAGAHWLGRERRRSFGVAAAVAVLAVLCVATWRHAGDYRDHETLGRSILRVNPESWLAHNHLGNEAIRRRDFATALDHLGRAEQLRPGRIETQINLAIARMGSGDLDGAEASARRAIAARDGAAIGHLLLGDALLRAGRFDEAAAAYAAALDRDRGSTRARAGVGMAQSRAGRHAAAVATLSAALAEDAGNVAARTALAYSLAELGRRDEAIAELERALALSPGDPRLRANLEWLRGGGRH